MITHSSKIRKWNWDQLKVQYIESEILEVKTFFLHFYGTFNSTIKHKTVGWPKAKKLHLKRSQFEAIAKIETKYSISIENALSDLLGHICSLIQEERKHPKMNIREIAILWRILRTTLGLPITYNASPANTQTNWQEESQELDKIIEALLA